MKEQPQQATPGRNDACWCGSGRKYKKCHMDSDRTAARPTAARPMPGRRAGGRAHSTLIKTAEQIAGIRRAGQLTREILDLLAERIEPGVSTEDINRWAHEYTLAHGGYPAPLNYRGFPKSVCTSVNEVVCHGIPDEGHVLQEGDIINVDVTSIVDGYYGDASRMYLVGEVSEAARRLVDVTRECMERGIAAAVPGGHVGDIGHAIQTHAEAQGYSVVRDFVGHGTGVKFHEDLQIPHFGQAGRGHPLLPGMVFTIEPMINAGDWHVRVLGDDWTAVTVDGSLSAQWEHTLTVTENGPEILTA